MSALLLVTVMVWVETVPVAMFALHVWHHSAMLAASEHTSALPHVGHANHACCPGFRRVETVPVLQFTAESQPCGDEHRCCFRQAPLGVPAPAASQNSSPDLAAIQIAEIETNSAMQHSIAAAGPAAMRAPPFPLGMVLRV
jgi:hypothetical protein